MKKIVIILPYYGRLPSYFDLFLQSALNNDKFDFLIITDNLIKLDNTGSNIHILNRDISWFKRRLQAVIDIPIVLDTPYKLCDYKPAYGLALQDEIRNYEFWGYCDSDIILGNLAEFITQNILDVYDRVYYLGHLCLYRNVIEMNELFKIEHNFKDCFSYRYVYSTKFICAFDEVGTKYGFGLSEICRRMKVREYRSIDFADVMPHSYNFILDNISDNKYDIFEVENGRLYGYKNNGTQKTEFAYIHLQKRKMLLINIIDKQHYYISPCAFRNTMEEANEDSMSLLNRINYGKQYKTRKIKTKIKKIMQGAIKHYYDKCYDNINV